jgi:thioredoxin-dependent peroxiredoxin
VNVLSNIVLAGSLFMAACQTTSDAIEVTSQSVEPRSSITWLGTKTSLVGAQALRVGARLPEVVLTSLKMEDVTLVAGHSVKVINTIPSIDTPVCDLQTHILSDVALAPGIERISISLDLPYAQRRFVEATDIHNISFYSDYRGQAFAQASGLKIERNGLLARSVIVVDQDGIVRHLQVVPEITQMPDMERAFTVANELAKSPI